MIMIDDDCEKRNIIRLVVPPHRGTRTQLTFKFRRMPDTTFNFKIGMRLLKWKNSYDKIAPKKQEIAQGNILWTEKEVFRTNKKHEMVGLPIKELIKKQNELILKKPLPIYYPLTSEDRKKYTLSISQNAIEKPRDTTVYGKKYVFTSFPLKLTNYGKETLKYINMSCSWEEIYKTGNSNMWVLGDVCDSNFPHVVTVGPQKSIAIKIPLVYVKGSVVSHIKFKMGMSLQKFIDDAQLFEFDPFVYLARPETSNLIWSNEVRIP